MKVVLDTNVIISALLWSGRTRKLLELIQNQKIIVYTCFDQITELKDVLARPKFRRIKNVNLTPEAIAAIFLEFATTIPQIPIIGIIQEDPADNLILACALASQAQFIITGDKHLLKLESFQGIKIIRPREFLKRLSSK